MNNVQVFPASLRGLSFSIADLIMIRDWSEACGLKMVIRLDLGSETVEYEEVLTFHTAQGRPCRWIIWRDAQAVFVQPLIERTRRYVSAADAIEALTPRRDVAVTDIVAPRWPDRRSCATE